MNVTREKIHGPFVMLLSCFMELPVAACYSKTLLAKITMYGLYSEVTAESLF